MNTNEHCNGIASLRDKKGLVNQVWQQCKVDDLSSDSSFETSFGALLLTCDYDNNYAMVCYDDSHHNLKTPAEASLEI